MEQNGTKKAKITILEDSSCVGLFERLKALAEKANLKLPSFIKKTLSDVADNEEQKK